ncbi:unnamed protein product [Acanthoscelides obtectus]|uniref:Uncharacterized protein n=1 Tax=Acanthoscelides obtectus TaxID=200917 RepID=A0A9P0P255_ACAOB|nr:unnamed protein product [Acanthoscelides obtectus]CAK1633847.1 hypothetical protein AOBTE_LOCUS8431 [Acanthoscelides obtectus]
MFIVITIVVSCFNLIFCFHFDQNYVFQIRRELEFLIYFRLSLISINGDKIHLSAAVGKCNK